jgi:hypothetical protein
VGGIPAAVAINPDRRVKIRSAKREARAKAKARARVKEQGEQDRRMFAARSNPRATPWQKVRVRGKVRAGEGAGAGKELRLRRRIWL